MSARPFLLASAALALAGASDVHLVTIKDVAFKPAEITVHVGDTVVWENQDIVAHTASSTTGGFNVDLQPGQRGSAVMTRRGSFAYICRYHPNMRGRVIVAP